METSIWQEYNQNGVITIGIINTNNQNSINTFVQENSITFPILFDPGSSGGVQGGDTYDDYYMPNDGSPYPRDFIIDQEGIIQYANNEIDFEWMLYVISQLIDYDYIIGDINSDSTVDICESYGAKIFQREYINSASQKNWALQFLTYDWVFQIDSDEFLKSSSQSIIRSTIDNASPDVMGFKMERRNHVLGRWVKYGGISPDYQVRLFNKNYCKWNTKNVHSGIITNYNIGILETPLIHHGVKTISQPLNNLNRYTQYEAEEMLKQNIKFSYFKLFLYPVYVFLKKYIYLQGFRDGWRGVFLALYTSFYVFIKHIKRLEIDILERKKNLD